MRLKIALLMIASVFSSCSSEVRTGVAMSTERSVYVLTMFDRDGDRIANSGDFPVEEYHTWFTEDWPVGGERLEIPENAFVCGVLVVSCKEGLFSMPVYRWQMGADFKYACQSYKIGKAPRFQVIAQGEQAFIDSVGNYINKK